MMQIMLLGGHLVNMELALKVEAAKSVMQYLPDNFKILVREALMIRKGKDSKSFYISRFKRGREAKIFIKYVIEYFNNNYFTNIKYKSLTNINDLKNHK